MYLLILFLPLFSAFSAGFLGRFIGEQGATKFTCSCLAMTAGLAYLSFYEVGICLSPAYIYLFPWMDTGSFSVHFGLCVDSITVVMLVLVTTVSTLVHIYSTSYMEGDPHLPRFMSYLSFFTFFMIILVTSNNLLQLFIGWEGVGLCSYLLINFWYTRLQANKSAVKAMVVNRVGDVGLALAMFATYKLFHSLDFSVIFPLAHSFSCANIVFLGAEVHGITLISVLLFIGAVGKSAQLGLHTWLPDAMEGPTPVSALIHAATMVTAGVFLIIRCSPLIEYSEDALIIILVFGALTAFFAATVGLVQNDLKRVIAYSTCSQLGYMVFACGLSSYDVSLFHLINHGFFKALLFLSAGSVIHAMADEQDMRRLGGLISSIPFTYTMILIGSLSLMGFPFLTGFYSKDAIIELAYANYSFDGTFAHWLGSLSAFFTAFYSIRLVYLTFIAETNSVKSDFFHSHEGDFRLSIPLVILSVGSIFFGYVTKDMMIGVGTPFYGSSIFTLPGHVGLLDAEFMPIFIKWVPVLLSFGGAFIALVAYSFFSRRMSEIKLSRLGGRAYTFLNNKWHFDYVYNAYVVKPLIGFGYNTSYKVLDRGLIEWIGPYGIAHQLSKSTQSLSSFQSGQVYNYAFTIFAAATLFLFGLGMWSHFTACADLVIGILVMLVIFNFSGRKSKV